MVNSSHVLTTDAGILTRDTNDVRNCDVLVACFLEANDKISIGTCSEMGMAHILQKPIVMIAKVGDPHREHAMISCMSGYIVEDLEEAAHVTEHLLTPSL